MKLLLFALLDSRPLMLDAGVADDDDLDDEERQELTPCAAAPSSSRPVTTAQTRPSTGCT